MPQTCHGSLTLAQADFQGNCQDMGKTTVKAERTPMPETTTNKGRTGDIGFATSLRIQEEKHQCGKASKPKEGGRQQPRNKADI